MVLETDNRALLVPPCLVGHLSKEIATVEDVDVRLYTLVIRSSSGPVRMRELVYGLAPRKWSIMEEGECVHGTLMRHYLFVA